MVVGIAALAGTVAFASGFMLAMHLLYSSIIDSYLDQWARSPPHNQVVIEAGSMRWEFGCTIYPVPWQFVDEYFRSKRDAVDRGFAPVYAKEWYWDKKDRSRFCYAGMRVADEGRRIVPPG